jgi:hypothetical protein
MANPGPAIAGIPNTELYVSTGPLQRVVWPNQVSTVTFAAVNGDILLNYFPCNYPVTATRMDALLNIIAASAATTATAAIAITANAGVYSSFLSTNTAGSTTAASLLSWGSTQTTYSYASGTAGNTQFITAGLRPVSVPININMSPGEYYVAFNMSTSQSSVGLSTTALGFSMSHQCGLGLSATNYAEITAVTSSAQGLNYFQGVYTTTSGALPLTIASTQVAQTGISGGIAGNYAFVLRNY